MRVAILCSGLGRVTRGYERFADDLNAQLRDRVHVDAFGSRGKLATSPITPIRCVSRDGILARIRFVAHQPYRNAYYWEAFSYWLTVLPRLTKGSYDILHIMDPPLVNFLHRVRRMLPQESRTVFTNGVGMHDVACTRVDHVHQVSHRTYEDAKAYLSADRMTLIPYPIDVQELSRPINREDARESLGLPKDAFIVLSVSALNRAHKRVDYLIEEVQPITDAVLLIVGKVEDKTLVDYGREVLGPRFFHRELPFNQVRAAYRASDLFVLASLEEGFAMSVVEAMILRLPVLVNLSDHFRWLVGDDSGLIEMEKPRALTQAIRDQVTRHGGQTLLTRADRAISRFSWDALRDDYIEMYRALSEEPRVRAAR